MNEKIGGSFNKKYYSSHKESMIQYSYVTLFENWPDITRKLGLKEDEFEKPVIDLAPELSEYEPGILMISSPILLMAYKNKEIEEYGLKINCKDLLKRDMIHECIHYLQDQFYNLDDEYSYVTEGLAEVVNIELLIEKEKYNLASTSIAEHFMDLKKEYKDYFGLPKEYNQHIERIIKDDSYKPPKRALYYAKGFFHICEKYKKRKNYKGLLRKPFKNSDIDELEHLNS